jgi:DNA-binding NarL/FixJ family response regulator
MKNNSLDIIIVDDHKLFRQSLSILLKQHLEKITIREAASGIELFDTLDQNYRPDIILLDLEMPRMSGIDTARKLLARKKYGSSKIIVLTMHNDKSLILDLIEEGVHGYVLKDADISEIIEAIHQVQQGRYYVSQQTFEAIRQNIANNESIRSKFTIGDGMLTEREKEILLLVCQEYTNKEIAEKLNLSVRTIDGHRNRLLKKVGARNAAGLVKFALRTGFYSLD